jgi:hypothetical protein
MTLSCPPDARPLTSQWFPLGGPGLVAFTALTLLGCSGQEIHHVSGTVTFKDKPAPLGKIYFTPDPARGNQGPTGFADIKDGFYNTALPGGQGTKGGPMLIHMEANDGVLRANGLYTPLFSYDTTGELPQATAVLDFVVPSSAGQKAIKDTGPAP